jgi:hypothetical protein
MRWAEHVARMGDRRGAYRVLVGRPLGKGPLGRPRRRWKMILKWICKNWDGEAGTGLTSLRIGAGSGRL